MAPARHGPAAAPSMSATTAAGTLSITNGGQVSGGAGYIGNATGSTGMVAVTGTGSLWASGEFTIHRSGTLSGHQRWESH